MSPNYWGFTVSIQLMCGNCHNILTILLTFKENKGQNLMTILAKRRQMRNNDDQELA